MSNSYNDFLRRYICYREMMNLSQKDAGQLCGRTQSQQSKMELGKTIVSFEILQCLLKADWDIDLIMTGKKGICFEDSLTDYLYENLGEAWRNLNEVLVWIIGRELDKADCFQDGEIKLEYELLKSVFRRKEPDTTMHEVRNIMGISQINMAEQLGVNIKKYRDLERGNTNPDAELLILIYEISCCRPSTFFYRENVDGYLLNSLWNRMNDSQKSEAEEFLNYVIKLYRA